MRPGGLDGLLATWQIGSVIAEVCERSGIPLDAIRLDGLEGGVDGIMASANQDAYSTIESLSGLFLFDVVNYDGQLHMLPRGGSPVATITLDDLVDNGEEIDKSERLDSIEVPRVLNLEYLDYDGGLTPDKQSSDRSLDIRSKGETRNQTSAIMRTADAARLVTIQHKVMIEEQRGGYEFALPDSWIWLTCGDIIMLEGERLRITEIEINDGYQSYKTAFDRASAYSSTVQGVPINQPSVPPTLVVGNTVLHFIDSHILEDSDDSLGYYLAANGPDLWRGCVVELSLDGGETYIDSDTGGAPTVMGELVTPLAAGSMYYPDAINSCRVQLLRADMTLSDATLPGMMNRLNLCLIGDEIVNFANADEVSPGLWDLSYFLRGRKGSTVASHSAGARFVMLDAGTLSYISTDLFLLGRSLTFRVTSLESDVSSAVFTVSFIGRSQTERMPAYLRANKSGSNIIIAWQGVGRLGGGGRIGMGAQFDGYRVTINGVAQTTTLQTLTVADPGGSVTINVSQINRITGVGPAITVVV